MNNKLLLYVALLIGSVCFMSSTLAEKFYPTNAEMKFIAQNLANSYPNIVSYHVLTTASKDSSEPVIALKISDNVNSTEDEPVWVFSGIIHGREALGYKTMETLAADLAAGYGVSTKVTQWVDAYEIWLIMSGNPVGYKANLRKNGPNTSNPNTSGVDLNRNWDFRWNQGGSGSTSSNNYRGTSPTSENEVSALQNHYIDRQPVYGVTFHQGNEPDGGQIMRPWSSSAASPPDAAKLSAQANQLADWAFASRQAGPLCRSNGRGGKVLEDPDGGNCSSATTSGFCRNLCWEPTQTTLGAFGQSSNAQYSKSGAIDLTVEMTDRLFNESFLHSNSGPGNARQQAIFDINTEVAKNWREAIKSWFQAALPFDAQRFVNGTGITGHVIDSVTDVPIKAVITVSGYTSTLINDRYSNSDFGRFHRFLPVGTHSVTVSANGYNTWSGDIIVQNDGMLTYQQIPLRSSGSNQAPVVNAGPNQSIALSSAASLNGTVSDDDLPVGAIVTSSWSKVSGPGTVTFTDANAVDTNARFSVAGSYVLRLTASDTILSSSDDVTITVTDGSDPDQLQNGVAKTGLSANRRKQLHYTLVVPAGTTRLSFQISGGSGDADLYVRFGSPPTTRIFDYRPYLSGNNETVNVNPIQAGTYYVMLRAFNTFSGVSLVGNYRP